jgi:hypothetical protein
LLILVDVLDRAQKFVKYWTLRVYDVKSLLRLNGAKHFLDFLVSALVLQTYLHLEKLWFFLLYYYRFGNNMLVLRLEFHVYGLCLLVFLNVVDHALGPFMKVFLLLHQRFHRWLLELGQRHTFASLVTPEGLLFLVNNRVVVMYNILH